MSTTWPLTYHSTGYCASKHTKIGKKIPLFSSDLAVPLQCLPLTKPLLILSQLAKEKCLQGQGPGSQSRVVNGLGSHSSGPNPRLWKLIFVESWCGWCWVKMRYRDLKALRCGVSPEKEQETKGSSPDSMDGWARRLWEVLCLGSLTWLTKTLD